MTKDEEAVREWRHAASEILAILADAGTSPPEGTYRDDPALLAVDVGRCIAGLRAEWGAERQRAVEAERERDEARAALRYIAQRNYIGANFVAGRALAGHHSPPGVICWCGIEHPYPAVRPTEPEVQNG